MFIGHFAVGLAAKRVAPRTSLAALFAAAQLIDLVWPILLLAGAERVRIDPGNTAFTPLDFESYPWTHSLLMVVVWAALFALVYWRRTGEARGAGVLAALVVSHWVLDFVTHRPDLPLAPGGVKVGLGLWNSVPASLAVEGGLFVAGVAVYLVTTRARNRSGSIALWSLLAFLVVVYAGNVLGPPPPSASAIGVVGLAMWLFLPWAAWIDRNREVVGSSSPAVEAAR
jgi:hypothetical protein